jgi:hypothetical protein
MPDADPYAPPQVVPAPTPSDVRLFGPEAIAAHTLLLTPLVGSILAATNHRRRGDRVAFRHAIAFYAVPSAILLVSTLTASHRFAALLRFASFAWTISVARRLFFEHEVLFKKHLAAGGGRARWYLATLATLGAFAIVLLAFVTMRTIVLR